MTDRAASLASVLRRARLFSTLDERTRSRLAAMAVERRLEPQTVLFVPGEPAEVLHLVASGHLALWQLGPEGQRLELHRVGPTELLGQMALLDGQPHSVGASAATRATVFALPVEAIRPLLESHPRLTIELAAILAERVRALSQTLLGFKFSPLKDRVLWRLQTLAAGRREIRLTHAELAEQVGGSRENVSRVLGELRDQRLIALHRGRLEVLDHARLLVACRRAGEHAAHCAGRTHARLSARCVLPDT